MSPATSPSSTPVVIRTLASLLASIAALIAPPARGSDYATPSGHPVPRWVSVSRIPAPARVRPDADSPLKWTLTDRGLPLQVIAETRDWRRVCDPWGRVAWIRRNNLSATRRVMALKGAPASLRAAPGPGLSAAQIPPGLIGSLDHCGAGWCRVRFNNRRGWSPLGELWGTLDSRQCP